MRNIATLLLVMTFPIPASATTIHVPDDQPTVSLGLANALPGDTVLVACGEYQDVYLTMVSGVTLKAEADGCVTLNAYPTNRILLGRDLAPGTRIEGFIFKEGSAYDGSGGAMSFLYSDVEIRACSFINNYAYAWGGAIQLTDCNALIESSLIQACEGWVYGGGIGTYGGTLTLRDCDIDWNIGMRGGGLYLGNCAAVVEDCTFTHNRSGSNSWGGAIFLAGSSTLQMSRSSVAGNVAVLGAGIFIDDGASATLAECIVAMNDGSGLHNTASGENPGELFLSCSDVFGNASANYGGGLMDQTGIDGNISANPRFCEIDAPDLPNVGLAQNSPCLPENNDCGVLMGARPQGCGVATAVPLAPAQARLLPNRPNPFNPATELRFVLAEPAPVRLAILDLAGRHLRVLLDGELRGAGEQRLLWDGQDDAGRALPSGVYFVRLDAAGQHMTRKVTLLK